MSLRDLGVFRPLKDDHPLIGDHCWKCGTVFAVGVRVALNPIETPDESGDRTVEAKPVCATCHLRGKEVMTPGGHRIVERIKDGNASPFPVCTTDGKQWQADEVTVT